jgi:GT2 family glycosyltransferase
MLTVMCSFHNARERAGTLLQSFLRTFGAIGKSVEFILIDDDSDPQQQIPALFSNFRSQIPQEVKITQLLFTQHQHYTRALAYGFSLAKGNSVLFVSHDMIINSEYVRTLLSVAALDESIGLVRGVSPYVDAFAQHHVPAPFNLRNFEDVESFGRFVSGYWGLQYVEDRLLTGDSFLVKRSVLDKIGTFDPRYFGYFGDIDFGLRVQRAGFKMVCAKGAWLYHEGAAAYKDQSQQSNVNMQEVIEKRMQIVNAAYHLFRDKWDKTMATAYHRTTDLIPLERLRHVPAPSGGEFQPFMTPDPAICTIR